MKTLAIILALSSTAVAGGYRGSNYSRCYVPHVNHVQHVAPVIVQKVFAVPHAYPGLYGVSYGHHANVLTPSLGDQAQYLAGQLEKVRLQVAADALGVAKADALQKTVFSFGVGQQQYVTTQAVPCHNVQAEVANENEVFSISGGVDWYAESCASCHSANNKARGGDFEFNGFDDLTAEEKLQAIVLVHDGDMPKGGKHNFTPAQRVGIIRQVSGCKTN